MAASRHSPRPRESRCVGAEIKLSPVRAVKHNRTPAGQTVLATAQMAQIQPEKRN
jgi:hypothetical protein